MTVTSRLFDSYLKCPTKCFLWSRGETGTSSVRRLGPRSEHLLS